MTDDQDNFRGRPLAWARRIKGEPARYVSARAAMEDPTAARIPFERIDVLPLGAVLFYDTGPHGDVGLYVGNDMVLRLRDGQPVVRRLNREPDVRLDVPVSWSLKVNP